VRGERAGAEAALVAAAVDLRLYPHARLAAHVERADALRPVHLVRGDRQQVGLELLHVDLYPAAALHRVAVEDDAVLLADLGDFPDRLDDADLVVGGHDGDQDRLVADRAAQVVEADPAVFLDRQIRHAIAVFLEALARVDHRLVLGDARDDVVALLAIHLGDALDRKVVAFRRARCKYDFF
jgi:hypothetical protein